MKDHSKWFDQLKNVSSISSNENSTSTLQETDQSKHVGTNATLHASLENVTDILKLSSRKTLQVLIPSNKNEEQENFRQRKNTYQEKTSDKYRALAIDKILEAVDGVLPMDKSVELSPKEPNMISRIF